MRVLFFLLGLFYACAAHADLVDLSAHSGFKKTYFIPAPEAQNTEVRLLIPTGEADHTGPEGLVHYLEHLVVWSADAVHGEGLRDREMNAWTSPYWTVYWNRGPAESFENMIRNARAVFEPIQLSQEFMETERDVVEREFDQLYRGNPTAVLYRGAYRHLYGKHSLGRSVIGTPETIRQISPWDALAFHAERYNPQDAYLLIFGPVPLDSVIAQLDKHLMDLPAVAPVTRSISMPLPAPPDAGLSLHLSNLQREEVLILGQATPPRNMAAKELWLSLLLLNHVLNSGQNGGLAKALYYDDFVVTTITAQLRLMPTGDIGFEFFFKPEDGVTSDEAIDRVFSHLNDLVAYGIPSESFAAIQNQVLQEVQRRAQDKALYSATLAQNSILNLGLAVDIDAYGSEIGRASLNNLNSVLRAIVNSPFITTAVAHPEIHP